MKWELEGDGKVYGTFEVVDETKVVNRTGVAKELPEVVALFQGDFAVLPKNEEEVLEAIASIFLWLDIRPALSKE